jgi:hypothetical protein
MTQNGGIMLHNLLGNDIGYYDSTKGILHTNDNIIARGINVGKSDNSKISELRVSGNNINNLIRFIIENNLIGLRKLIFLDDFNQNIDYLLSTLVNLEELTFGENFINLVNLDMFPISLIKLTFGHRFNQNIGNSLSRLVKLQELTFGKYFNNGTEDIILGMFPISLIKLTFGSRLHIRTRSMKIIEDSLSRLVNLKELTLGNEFNQNMVTFPISLTELTFGFHFNQNIEDSISNLVNLIKLTFGGRFNQNIERLSRLVNLKELTFGNEFNQNIENSLSTLVNLKELTVGDNFNQNIGTINLKELIVGRDFNKNMVGTLPISLIKLTFRDNFTNKYIPITHGPIQYNQKQYNQKLENSLSTLVNLQELNFGYSFNENINMCVFPISLIKLTFGTFFNQNIGNRLSRLVNLKELTFGNNFNNIGEAFTNITFPTSLIKLTFGHLLIKSKNIKSSNIENSLSTLVNLKELSFYLNLTFPNCIDKIEELKYMLEIQLGNIKTCVEKITIHDDEYNKIFLQIDRSPSSSSRKRVLKKRSPSSSSRKRVLKKRSPSSSSRKRVLKKRSPSSSSRK